MPLIKLNATQALTGALPAVSGASLTGLATDFVKLHTTTVSSGTATVDINGYFSSTYDTYKIIGMNVKGTDDHEYISGRVMVGGSAQSSSHSSILPGFNVNSSGSTTETNYSKGGNRFYLFKNSTHQSHMFELTLTFPLKTDEHKVFTCLSGGQSYESVADLQSLRITSGRYESDSALSGFQFLTGDGTNITSGTFTLYGIK